MHVRARLIVAATGGKQSCSDGSIDVATLLLSGRAAQLTHAAVALPQIVHTERLAKG
jgi:hypothetical protein